MWSCDCCCPRPTKKGPIGLLFPFSRQSIPMNALKNWLKLTGTPAGPLFRPINRYDQVANSKALTPQFIARIMKVSAHDGRRQCRKLLACHRLGLITHTKAKLVRLQPLPHPGQSQNRRFKAYCGRFVGALFIGFWQLT